KTDNLYAGYKLRIRSGLENVQAGVDFVRQRLSALDDAVSDERKHFFIKEMMRHYALPADTFPGQVVLTSLSQASAYADRHMFCMGFYLESVVSRREHTLFTNHLYSDAGLVELLESPSYVLHITLERIKQILGSQENLFVTAPEFDFTDKPTTKLQLGRGYELAEIVAPYPEVPVYQPLANDYFQSKKKNFSLSSLEEYVNCPYRYYAAYHLKLDSPTVSDVEPAPPIKGLFVHKVLQRLIAENESDYLEGLEYESYRKKVINRLAPLIQEEINKTQDLKIYPPQMVDFFAYRVYKTIINLVSIEAENYKKAKKRTVPMYYEWCFGYDNKNSFMIDTRVGKISLRGRIDRIDVSQAKKQFAVIDYKTGSYASVADMRAGKSLQLPIYLMAIKEILFPEGTPTGAYYYVLKTNDIKGFTIKDTVDADLMHARSQLSWSGWQDMQEAARHSVSQAIQGIHEGRFDPLPQSEQLCRFCDYKKICGFSRRA
ncbi:PD-(D/E)XK nuclease family protein, partial [bacterium]|nr:PD-(D/E)XK nuclease family protein [bacterium]